MVSSQCHSAVDNERGSESEWGPTGAQLSHPGGTVLCTQSAAAFWEKDVTPVVMPGAIPESVCRVH